MHPHRTETTFLAARIDAHRRRVRQPLLRIGMVVAMLVVWRHATAASNAATDNAPRTERAMPSPRGPARRRCRSATSLRSPRIATGISGSAPAMGSSVSTAPCSRAGHRRAADGGRRPGPSRRCSARVTARSGSAAAAAGGIARMHGGRDHALRVGCRAAARRHRWPSRRIAAERSGPAAAAGCRRFATTAGSGWQARRSWKMRTVYSIYEDRDGRLWLGTSKGCTPARVTDSSCGVAERDVRAGLRAGPPRQDVDHRHEGDDQTARHGRGTDSRRRRPRAGGWLAHGVGSRRHHVGGGSRRRADAPRRRRLREGGHRALSVRAQDCRISAGESSPTVTRTSGSACAPAACCASPGTTSTTTFRSKG